MRLGLALVAAGLIAAVGLAFGLGLTGGRASDTRPPNPMTKRIVACQRSGKLICDRAALRRDRREGSFPLSKPDPKGAHLLTLGQVLPPSWRHEDYSAELMTYGEARKIVPDLAGATSVVINPSRKFWVLTLYHRPPITVPNTETGPLGMPSTIRVRVESQSVDAVTGMGMDSCVNCAAIREVRYLPEGVTLMTPLPGYHPAVSRRAVLALYHRWPARPHLQGKRTVRLWTVRDALLPQGGYPAWVLTLAHTSPSYYRPGEIGMPVPTTPGDCTWVAIYNLEARVWTENFQNCPEKTTNYPNGHKKITVIQTCDSGCTPANQDALDAAANYAEKIAGAAHAYTGVRIDDSANQVILYLAHAPGSVVDRLDAAHPGTYLIHNDAPRTHRTLMRLENTFDFKILKPEDIQVLSVGPSVDGYLEVGVSSKVAEAQAKLDDVYGENVVRVFKASPAVPASLTIRSKR